MSASISRRNFVQAAAAMAGVVTLAAAGAPASHADEASEGAASEGAAGGAAPAMEPGTYTAEVMGHNGPFEVSVTVGDGVIEDVAIGDNDETRFVGTHSMEQVRLEILEAQTPNVDTVAGATISTNALVNGVAQALEQAGAPADAFGTAQGEPVVWEDATTQVVVVGSGSAGLAATMQAFQDGLDVILVEQLGVIGGSSGRAGYYVGGGHRVAAQSGDDYSMEEFRDLLVQSNPNQTELAALLGERAGESIDWLVDLGLTATFYDLNSMYGRGLVWGDYGPIGGFMTQAMLGQLDANGVDYRMNTKVTSLIEQDGRIAGVNVETADGQAYAIHADAVVLATGGYAHNAEMVDEYTPELSGYGSDASMGSDGSGMLMAQEVGGVLENMSDVISYYGENVIYNGVPRNMTYPFLATGPIVINEAGRRFVNELTYYDRATVDAFNEQPGRHGYVILTKTQADALLVPALDYSAHLPQMFTECADLDEVAVTAGVDAATLQDTVERYNAFVDAGVDEDFGKSAEALAEKFEEGPFYVAEVQPCTHMTYGGIRVDLGMHVLDEADAPIEGLYAVGECTHVMLNGIGTNTIALVEGRLVIEQIEADLA